ncbi:MAG: YerC/YecD family TrpR-related protein [Acutalibacteraceae bacterium]
MNLFENEGAHLLIDAFKHLDNEEELKNFLTDLLTTKELLDMSQRMQVASLLRQGMVYSKIAEITGASTATISRVSRCYSYGENGYKAVFDKLEK